MALLPKSPTALGASGGDLAPAAFAFAFGFAALAATSRVPTGRVSPPPHERRLPTGVTFSPTADTAGGCPLLSACPADRGLGRGPGVGRALSRGSGVGRMLARGPGTGRAPPCRRAAATAAVADAAAAPATTEAAAASCEPHDRCGVNTLPEEPRLPPPSVRLTTRASI